MKVALRARCGVAPLERRTVVFGCWRFGGGTKETSAAAEKKNVRLLNSSDAPAWPGEYFPVFRLTASRYIYRQPCFPAIGTIYLQRIVAREKFVRLTKNSSADDTQPAFSRGWRAHRRCSF
jgi:hypothetical protein